jgi:hypothetical protein
MKLSGRVSEASPPEVIQQLRAELERYQPQVSIVTPKPNELLQDNTVSVQFRVKDLPIFKDEKLGLGPHLDVFLDDQPYQAVYDVSQPLVLKDLAPGTHTIRVFAGRPWHESFKNDGAYAQTTFHIFTRTPSNNPKPDLPLLTYSRPQGAYGAEPILLDFYLTNAPLHFVAQEDVKDEVSDWRVRVSVNGDSFDLDRWQPVYLRGLQPGKNWVQVEYIDENGNPVPNVYNNTARIFTYEPNGQDTLSKLVRGELSLAEAKGIVDPNYNPELQPAPIEAPAPIEPPVVPSVPVIPVPKAEEPTAEPETPAAEVEEQVPETVPAPVEEAKPKGGFFDRFKRPEPITSSSPEPIPTEPEATPEPELTPTEPSEEVVPEVEATPEAKPKGGFFNRFKGLAPKSAPVESPSPEPIPTEVPAVEPEEPQPEESNASEEEGVPEVEGTPEPTPKGGFFNRFKGFVPKAAPSIESPSPEPIPTEVTPEETPEEMVPEVEASPEASPKGGLFDRFKGFVPKSAPVESPPPESIPTEVTPSEVAPEVEATPEAKPAPTGGLFDRFKRSEPAPLPSVSPTPLPTELTAPETESPAETVPEVTEPEVKTAPKPSFFDRFKPSIAPSPNPVESVEPAQPAEIEEPEVKPAPTGGLFDRFKQPETKPSEAPSVEAPLEEPSAIEEPEPEVKTAPKGGFFNRFKLPQPKSAPSVAPGIPEVPVEEIAPAPAEPPEPEVKATLKVNVFDRFKSPSFKPSAPAESAPPEVPKVEAPETPGFAPQSELERRLGVPVKPPIAPPAKPIVRPQPIAPTPEAKQPEAPKFAVPKSSDLFKRRESNPFFRSGKSTAPAPVEAPAASEAPTVESPSEGVPIEEIR